MPAFPESDMELAVQTAWGADVTAAPSTWTWSDLTCAHPSIPAQTISRLLPTPITIKRGVVVGAASKAGTTATLHMFNHDGALTPFLPTSPYYPNVDAGTPVRLQRRNQTTITDTFTRTAETNGWGTSDSGDQWTPTGTVSAYSTTGTQARIGHTAINTSRVITLNRAIRDVDVVFDAAMSAVQTGIGSIAGPQLRRNTAGTTMLWPHIVFGLSGVVQLRLYRYLNSSFASVGTFTVPALTYSAGTLIRCRVQVEGTTVRMRAWLAAGAEPSTWHVTFSDTPVVDTGEQIAMATSVFTGNTNTLPAQFTLDNISISQIPTYPLEGYITDIRPQFLPQPDGTTWSTVLVDVGGVGSRLEKQQAPSFSPLRRSVQLAAIPPIAYWPLEDAEGSVSGTSAFPGGPKMVVTGPAVFGFGQGVPDDIYQSRYGTKPMVSVAAGAKLSASVPMSTVQTEWAVSFVGQFYAPDVPAVTEVRILQWETPGGTYTRWAFVATATGYQLRAYNDVAGTTTVANSDAFGSYAAQLSYTIEASQVGGNISTQLFYNDNSFAGAFSIAGTLAPISQITVNPDRTNTTASVTPRGLKFIIGHVRVTDETSVADLPFYADPITGNTVYAGNAWYLETAHERIKRLCAEERVPCEVLGDPASTGYTQLNAQQDGTFTTLVTQAAESESGAVVYEGGFGYKVLPRTARYNQAPALTVDLDSYRRSSDTDQADVLVPQLESRLANYWTVSRANGSSGSYAASAAFRARRGTINEEVTIDALSDDVLDSHAAWRVHRNVDYTGAYYPSTPVDLAANPDLIDDWLECDIGSRVQRINQPTLAGIATIDQVIEGVSETLGPRTWNVEITGAPAEVWDVAVTDQVLGKADTDSSTFRVNTSTATSLLIDVLAGPRWTTDPAQMPIYVTLATGEDIQITAISGTSNPQTATCVRSLNGIQAAIPASTPFRLTKRQTAAL
ncbi:hypothetical protein ACQP2Y_21495 [Actinoplanes sp. CA-051413]|uniref:hypothetical protein n=1 Tax=Actinoplanes sp. CA-051413 TaxID=3239899 RepID=UPI003D998573